VGYFEHTTGSGLGLNIDDLMSHVRKLEKREQEHEKQMAPLINETYALQMAALQTQQQVGLQEQQLTQQAARSSELMKYLPYVLGGVGLLGALVLVIRGRRKRR
jgi:hypothetical protein